MGDLVSLTGPGAGLPKPAPARPLYEVWKERARLRQQQEQEGVPITLPSGMPVRVKRIPLILLAQRGKIPDSLTPIVNRYINEIKKLETEGDDVELTPEEKEQKQLELIQKDVDANPAQAYNDFVAIIDFVFQSCVVEPRFYFRYEVKQQGFVLPDEQAEPLYLDFGPQGEFPDVDDADKLYVYQFCQGVDQTVEEFFRQQADALGTLPDGQDVPLSAEGDIRADELQRRLVGVSDRPGDVGVGDVHRGQDAGDEGGSAQASAEAERGDRPEVHAEADQPDARHRARPRKRKGR